MKNLEQKTIRFLDEINKNTLKILKSGNMIPNLIRNFLIIKSQNIFRKIIRNRVKIFIQKIIF